MAIVSKSTYDSYVNANIASNAVNSITGTKHNKAHIDLSDSVDRGVTSSFTNGDLSSNVLTINHNLGRQYVFVSVFDNNNVRVPDINYKLTCVSVNQCTLEFPGAITGTYNYIVKWDQFA